MGLYTVLKYRLNKIKTAGITLPNIALLVCALQRFKVDDLELQLTKGLLFKIS